MMRQALRIVRWLCIAAAVVLGTACVAVLSAYAVLQSSWGRAQIVQVLNRALSSPDGTQVRIERIAGDLPGTIEMHGLVVGDVDGTWLELEFARARWRPAALLRGRLRISNLEAHGLTVIRRPGQTQSTAPFEWPELPIGISVARFLLSDAVIEQPVLGETVKLRASGDTAIEGADRVRTRIDVVRTDGVSGQMELDMLVKPRSEFLRFEIALNEGAGGMISRALNLEGLPSISFQAAGEGVIDSVRGTARARAGALASLESEFTIDAAGGPALTLKGKTLIAGLVGPPLADLLSDEIAFAADGELKSDGVVVKRATMANRLARIELSGRLAGDAAVFEVALGVPDLTPFSQIAGVALRGQANIESRIRSDAIGRAVTASTRATITEALPPESPLRALAGSSLMLAGTFDFDDREEQGRLRVRDLAVTADSAQLSADGMLRTREGGLEFDYRLKLPRLAALSEALGTPLAGGVDITGKLGGTLADPTLTAVAISPDLAVDGTPIGGAEARIRLTRLINGIGGDIDVSIVHDGVGAVVLGSRISSDNGDSLRLDDLSIEARETKLSGAVVIDLAQSTASGRLAGEALALAPWSDLAGRALSGSAGLVLEAKGEERAQRLDLGMTVSGLQVAFAPSQSLQARSVEATARVGDLFGARNIDLQILASGAVMDDARIASLVLDVDMVNPKRASGRLEAQGDLHGPFELRALAGYEAGDDGGIALDVAELDASLGAQAIRLSKPTRITHESGATTLSKSTVAIAGGHLVADGRIDAGAIKARLEVEGIALAAIESLTSMADMTGTLSGHMQISGRRSAPVGEVDLKMVDVRSGQATLAAMPPASARLRGEWRDRRLSVVASLSDLTQTSIEARGSAPLVLDAETLALTMPANQDIDGELRWSGELEPVWDLLSTYEDRFTGPGDLAVKLAGTVGNPRISGHFQVAGGRYENVLSGTSLTEVNLRLVGDGDELVLEKLTAGDGKSGSLQGSGRINVVPAQSYPINVRLVFSDMLLVARDDLILNAGGNLALEGTLTNMLLSGEIVTGQSELSLAGTLPPNVVELEVAEVNRTSPSPAAKTAPANPEDPSIVVMDLDLSVPGRAFVRGLGLDSEWKGKLKIRGKAHAPNVAGVLNPVRGHFSLLGKRFDLEKGDIRFTGSNNVDPLLDLTAERKTTNLTAMVRVTGSASQPKVTLTSRPPLPESEIASQVLFGTDSANLSPAQSLQLASAIATYSGTGGAVGILDQTRRSLGVDVIGFSESEQDPEKTRVSVGKYVADGVYLEVEGGGTEDSRTATTVEVEVLPDVRIEGGTTEGGGNKVGIKWKWDY